MSMLHLLHSAYIFYPSYIKQCLSALISSTERTVYATYTVFIIKPHFEHCVLAVKSK